MTLCNVTCPVDDMTQVVNQCQDVDNLIEIKADRLAFIKCESTMVSLTDAAEWQTLKEDGKIITTPQFSEFELAEPETIKIKAKECSVSESVIGKTQKIPIDTIMLDTVTKTDEDFVCDFYKKIGGYTMILGVCGNTIFYRKSWVTTENPGFGGLVGDLNYVTKTVGNRKYLALKGSIEFDLTEQCWARLDVGKEVYDAIFN